MRSSNAAVDLRRIDCGDVTGNVIARTSKPIPTGAEEASTARVRRIWTAGEYDRIAAGFRDTELPQALGLDPAAWQIECRTTLLGAYHMVATRRKP